MDSMLEIILILESVIDSPDVSACIPKLSSCLDCFKRCLPFLEVSLISLALKD